MAPRKRRAPKKLFAAQERKELFAKNISRARLIQRMAGVQYHGRRDIYEAAGYVPQDEEKFDHYWGLYQRDGIGGRIVDIKPNTTWRTPPSIMEPDKPEGTKFTEAFEALSTRLKLWQMFQRIDRLSGIGHYGVMMIGVAGAEDYQLTDPLDKVRGPDDIVYLGVYHERNAQIQSWQMDTSHPRFGLPELYKLTVVTQQYQPKWTKNVSITVHHSRCLHIAEGLLQDEVFGMPRLQRVLNRLFDLDKVSAATGEAYWQLVSKILQATIDPESEIDDTELKKLDEQMEEMIHDLRRQFTGQGINLEWLSATPPDPSTTADFYFSMIAGASGIPKRILFGSELGELASSQDQANYLGQINERQEQFAEPSIVRAFIDRMIEIKALPEPASGEYEVVWPTLYEESTKDRAESDVKISMAAKNLTPVGGNPLSLVDIDTEGHVQLVNRSHDDPLPDSMTGPPEPDPDLTDEVVGGEPNADEEPSVGEGHPSDEPVSGAETPEQRQSGVTK